MQKHYLEKLDYLNNYDTNYEILKQLTYDKDLYQLIKQYSSDYSNTLNRKYCFTNYYNDGCTFTEFICNICYAIGEEYGATTENTKISKGVEVLMDNLKNIINSIAAQISDDTMYIQKHLLKYLFYNKYIGFSVEWLFKEDIKTTMPITVVSDRTLDNDYAIDILLEFEGMKIGLQCKSQFYGLSKNYNVYHSQHQTKWKRALSDGIADKINLLLYNEQLEIFIEDTEHKKIPQKSFIDNFCSLEDILQNMFYNIYYETHKHEMKVPFKIEQLIHEKLKPKFNELWTNSYG